ncbi:MAG TPA: choice-of-anchor D domain-containing protein [Candidatus Eremiobacteraceae bacterium]|nr:choice-of-anchor D domain-containing protein [Candidatus Eremiobacteraceae bacterium]
MNDEDVTGAFLKNSSRRIVRLALQASLFLALSAPFHFVRAAEPLINLSVNHLEFGPQGQGTPSAYQSIILTNNGGADLVISTVAVSGENRLDFVQTNNCPTAPSVVPAMGHCEIRVVFNPTIAGELKAVLNISDNASGSPQAVDLKGTATAPGPSVVFGHSSLGFGNQPLGTTSAPHVVTLTNNGSATMNVNSDISINGAAAAEFHLQPIKNGCPSGSWQLAPKTSCDIGVVFAPTSLGAKNAQISIIDDAPGSPHSVQLSGAGTAPQPR